MKDVRLPLVDILERARRIEQYVEGGRERFDASPMVQDAVLRNLEVIGEAAKRIGDEERARWPSIPWRRMAGLRDVLIHAYETVDLAAVWSIATGDLPAVRRAVEEVLRDLGVDPGSVP